MIVLVFALLAVPAAQAKQAANPDGTITIEKDLGSLGELIQTIESQTEYLVVFSNNDMDPNKVIHVKKGTYTISNVLEQILKNDNIGFDFDNNYIILKKIEAAPAAQAKAGQVSGIVKDEEGNPLIGVGVSVRGKNVGVGTRTDGTFSIMAAHNDFLEFSYIGYKTRAVFVGSSTYFDIVLAEDATLLDDVVVTGYGNFRKSTYTGAVSVVNMEKLNDIPALSAAQMLEAQVPGLSISSNSHQPGAYKSLRIRGVGSMNASNSPLIVLDGVPIVSTNYAADSNNATGLDAFSTINPSDIESITVLKDATSTALYGARGSNGVIHISTKRGKEGPTRFSFKAHTSFTDFAMKYRQTMGGQERRELIYEGYINEYLEKGETEAAAIEYADSKINISAAIPEDGWSDWKDAMTKTGFQQGYDLSVTGGNANTNFAASLGYADEKGVVISSMFKRYSGRLALNHKYKKFDFGVNTMFSVTENDSAREDDYYASPLYAWVYSLTPSIPIYKKDGSYNTDYSVNGGGYNPLHEEKVNDRYTKVYRFLGNITVGWQFTDFLRLSSTLGVEQSTTREFKHFSPESMDGRSVNGSSYMRSPAVLRYTSSTRLGYEQMFGLHSINATTVFEVFSHSYEQLRAGAEGFGQLLNNGVSNAANPVNAEHYLEEDRMVSVLALANYSYADKYYLSATYRNDASSRLAKRHANFWSVSGSWRVTQEDFAKPAAHWLTDLKIKASYGVNGTLPNSWFSHYRLYSASSTYTSENAIKESSLGNPNLSWEKGYNANIGLDITLFNKISVDFSIYQRDTKDLLMDEPIPAHIGFYSQVRNVGHLRNRGVELEISSVNMQKNDFRWTSSLNIGSNRTKVVKTNSKGEDMYSGRYIFQEGKPYYTLYVIESAGVNPENGKMQYYYNHSGEGYGPRDLTENVGIASRTPYKNIEPKLTGGITNTFTYGQFDLSFMFSFSLGGHSLDNAMWAGQDDGYRDYINKSTELRRRWKNPGDKTDVPKYVNAYRNGGYYTTSRGVRSTDHLRLKNLSFGARMPKKWADAIGMNSARVYFVGTNLLTWSDHRVYDPELTGAVYINMPPLKSFSFGIEFGF